MSDLPAAPAVDYSNKDFASLRQAMLDFAAWRLPEWTDRSAGDLGMLLVDLFAYVGDVVCYYQDRIASEAFLPTAAERRSVQHLLRLIGYELAPPGAATTELDLTFEKPKPGDPTTITIKPGTGFATKPDSSGPRPKPALRFEYLGDVDLLIDLTSSKVGPQPDGTLRYVGLPVVHAETQPAEALGTSTGESNQRFGLRANPVVLRTLVVEVQEGAGFVRWDRRRSLLYDAAPGGRLEPSTSGDRHYVVEHEPDGRMVVEFGDGEFGMIPSAGAAVRARYAVGGGTAGNVPPGAISVPVDAVPGLKSVTNPRGAVGGTDAESIDHARRFGPIAFRSGDRAVTLRDYTALAHQVPGVAKVRARTGGWNRVDLVVVPVGKPGDPVSDELRTTLLQFFEDRKMLGTALHVVDATAVPIDVRIEVVPEHHHEPGNVAGRVRQDVEALLAFDRVELGRPLYLSKVYEAVEAIDGVAAAVVTRFRRRGLAIPAVALARSTGLEAQLPGLGKLVQRTYLGEIPVDGRIEIGDFEIAVLGSVNVELRFEGL